MLFSVFLQWLRIFIYYTQTDIYNPQINNKVSQNFLMLDRRQSLHIVNSQIRDQPKTPTFSMSSRLDNQF